MPSKNKLSKDRHAVDRVLAPLDIPLHRRLETFAVILMLSGSVLLTLMGYFVLIYIVLYTNYGIIALIYAFWMYYDRNTPNRGGRRFDFIRRLGIWKSYCDYFPITLVKTQDLDPSKNYLFTYHPHGILPLANMGCFGTEGRDISKVFPGIKMFLFTLESNFGSPIARDYIMSFGSVSATRESIVHVLTKKGGGNGGVLVPGGAAEVLDTRPHTNILRIKNRKGFIKLALQIGVPLVPVFTFGETDLFNMVNNDEGSLNRKIQQKLLKLTGYALPLFWGRGIFNYAFGFLPLRRPLTTIVGAPIMVDHIEHPSQEDIDNLHAKYIDALKELFYLNRDKYGESDAELEFV